MDKPAILSNPEAFVVVPVEPSPEVIEAVCQSQTSCVWPDEFGHTAQGIRRKFSQHTYRLVTDSHPRVSDIAAYCAALEAENERLQGVETPAPEIHSRAWTQADAERENAAFTDWFKARCYPDYPDLYPLTAENAMHSAWQEAAKRATAASDGSAKTRIAELRAERDAAYRKGAEDMRERAAAWHDAKVAEYTDQIAVNDAYLARSSRPSSESRANEYCDDMRSGHRRAAAAIRKLEAKP